jgi:hypothetical protein
MPDPYHSYVIFASPGPTPNSGVASIWSTTDGPRIQKNHLSQSGGEAAALASAEAHLDKTHAGLTKLRSPKTGTKKKGTAKKTKK